MIYFRDILFDFWMTYELRFWTTDSKVDFFQENHGFNHKNRCYGVDINFNILIQELVHKRKKSVHNNKTDSKQVCI